MKKFFFFLVLIISVVSISAQNITTTADTTNMVYITYNGNSASAIVCENIVQYVSISMDKANVKVVQSSNVSLSTCGEITYVLGGSSSNGSFYIEGSFKSTLSLQDLNLTNPNGPAIDVQNGKRIEVSIKRGTTNTLTDGVSTELNAWKGCFQCKGHTEFKGYGTLNIYANYAHGIWSKEYITVKNCIINIFKAPKDAINCNQYFSMESGEINLSGFGDDGIQVSLKTNDTSAENTGDFTLAGGTINIDMNGASGSGIKATGTKTAATTATLNILGEDTAIEINDDADQQVTIYGINGYQLGTYQSVAQAKLPSGTYIAVSKQGKKKIQIK